MSLCLSAQTSLARELPSALLCCADRPRGSTLPCTAASRAAQVPHVACHSEGRVLCSPLSPPTAHGKVQHSHLGAEARAAELSHGHPCLGAGS